MNVSVSKNVLNVTIGETSLKLLTSAVVNVDGDADTLQGEDGAYYLDRSNHTGTQAIGTIDGLQAALDNKIESVAWGDITGTLSNQTDLQDALDLKLDAADYNDRFLGLYASLFDLQAAHPTASAGDYAQVDLGIGTDVIVYAWDVNDAKWAAVGSSAIANTDALPEGSTNLYHTSQRVRDVTLTGFTASSTPITATDSIVQAFGKAQGQLNGMDAGRTLVHKTLTRWKERSNNGSPSPFSLALRGVFDTDFTIPANTLVVGDVYRLEMTLFVDILSAQSGSYEIAPIINGGLFSIGATNAQFSVSTFAASQSVEVSFDVAFPAIGASGRIIQNGLIFARSQLVYFNGNTLAIDTTQPITLNYSVRFTASTVVAGNAAYIKSARLYKISDP